jgi:dTDP-4-dehydrorhamnose reductase
MLDSSIATEYGKVMTLFVLGAGGQMGSAFELAAAARGLHVALFRHEDCDVRDEGSLSAALAGAQNSDVVINAAAQLGTKNAEDAPRAQAETNAIGAMQAAFVARKYGAAIVHLSTDYVFDGTKSSPYVESDTPNPLNMYGALKLTSEVLVRGANPRAYVTRISSLFGRSRSSTKGPNFVDAMLATAKTSKEVKVDAALIMSPTYALDAANVVLDLIDKRAPYGVYHCANAGACSWLEFAQAIFELAGLNCRTVPRDRTPDNVPRPSNSSLKSEKLSALGIRVRPWRGGLAAYLAERS